MVTSARIAVPTLHQAGLSSTRQTIHRHHTGEGFGEIIHVSLLAAAVGKHPMVPGRVSRLLTAPRGGDHLLARPRSGGAGQDPAAPPLPAGAFSQRPGRASTRAN